MSSHGVKASNILIVDDILDNLNMLADMLEDQGHQVRIATNGKAALEAVKEKIPDLILLDIQMPGMDGYEVCSRIKADDTSKDIPVIFLSAHTETSDILRGFDVGGVDYVGKPFQFREVVARVQSQLAIAQNRQEVERLRERDHQQFEQLNKMKDRFLHAAAHDLKNPLTGVLLYSQLLRTMKPAEANDLGELADGIEQSARKMQRLITDLLDLAQMQIGEPLPLYEMPVQPLLESVVKQFDMLAQEKQIRLSLSAPKEAIRLNLNPNQFERVLDNLISNGLKYTPEGGTVEVILEAHLDHALVAVVDSGLGIPEDDLPHVFEAFYRVKKPNHKKITGSGLGLSIVAAIVEQHHGDISVQSEVDKGSSFIVRIPR